MQHNLTDLLKQGESQTLDFKQKISRRDKIARSLCAFANTRGGVILVGVNDQGLVIGIDPEEEKYMLTEAALHYCSPAVLLHFEEIEAPVEEEEDEKIVLKVTITESSQKPHTALNKAGQGQIYIRQHDKTVPADKNMNRIIIMPSDGS